MLLAGLLLLTSCLAQLSGWGARDAVANEHGPRPPLPGAVLREFQVGEFDWEPGHRGVDLAGQAGEQVRAPAPGTISWVGTIAGVPMLTVQHPDGLRTTYQPVQAALPVGAAVAAGDQIATLASGHCAAAACLHWGLRAGEQYLDPLAWVSGASRPQVRLRPGSAVPRPPPAPGVGELVEGGVLPSGELPVAGPITSAWGGRTNPISGTSEFHDGVDIGAACGLPVQTLWPGVVSFAGSAGGYGLRVEVDHGAGHSSSYSHLSGIAVGPGESVVAGQVIGAVGTTGYSTGCHLHYSVIQGGRSVDPLTGGG